MAANYVLLERIELNASAASVTFSNIPQSGYTDLLIKISARDSDTSGALTQVSFNGVTTNLSSRRLRGTGSAATSTAFASNIYTQGQANGDTANTFGNSEIYIPNYTSSNYKSVSEDGVSENNATAAYMQLTAGLWSSTAAITSVTLTSAAGPYLQYSTFSLYGLAAVGTTPVIAPKASGGNITTDGTYWYHTFLTTGTFTPAIALTSDVLVIGGGAGGGYIGGGGGGAGGLCYQANRSIAASAYTITVGAGGAGAPNDGNAGLSGSSSVLDTITALGGGGGANSGNGISGASGGGSGWQATYSGGSATQGNSGGATGYGNAGGGNTVGSGSPNYPCAGGGGAGGAGQATQSSSVAGYGGVGLTYTTIAALDAFGSATSTGQLSGGHYYYAGGGGGSSGATNGAGGLGGGATGSSGGRPAATANTGGGGGGGGGNGGSGVVIIRYLVA